MSGYCFCASENAICWGGFSTASSATTCQRRKDSKSPVLRSIATRTSTSSLKRLPSPERRTPRPCGRSSPGRAHPPAAAARGSCIPRASWLGYQARAVELGEVEREPAAVVVEFDPLAFHRANDAGEIPAAVHRMAQAHLGLMAGKTGKIRRLFQAAIQARGGNLQPVVIDPFDFEHPLQLLANGCAVGKGHPRRVRPNFMYLLNKHS